MNSNQQIVTTNIKPKELFPGENKRNNYLNTKRERTLWDNENTEHNNLSKKTRWDSKYSKVFTPLPVANIPNNIDIDQFENLLRKQRINDILKRLNSNIFEEDDPDLREPSPEPIYDPKGKRINTRAIVNRERLLNEKNNIIAELIKYDSKYVPPFDYKPPKKQKIIYIKNNEKYNFVKYIIGAKGQTLKELEKRSKCKLSIRGKGSNWNYNNNNSYNISYYLNNHNEDPLHVFIEGDTDEDIKKAEEIILPLLDENSDEYQQIKMALVKSNYNSNEPACEFCGEKGHKSWACPLAMEQEAHSKVEIKCKHCGDKGHLSCDCPIKNKSDNDKKQQEIDEEEFDKNKIMNKEINNFFKEIEDFSNKKKDKLYLDKERKPNDIRNSVLLTGKININNNNSENSNNNNQNSTNPSSENNNDNNNKKVKEISSTSPQNIHTIPSNLENNNNIGINNPNIKTTSPIQYNYYTSMINPMPYNPMMNEMMMSNPYYLSYLQMAKQSYFMNIYQNNVYKNYVNSFPQYNNYFMYNNQNVNNNPNKSNSSIKTEGKLVNNKQIENKNNIDNKVIENEKNNAKIENKNSNDSKTIEIEKNNTKENISINNNSKEISESISNQEKIKVEDKKDNNDDIKIEDIIN